MTEIQYTGTDIEKAIDYLFSRDYASKFISVRSNANNTVILIETSEDLTSLEIDQADTDANSEIKHEIIPQNVTKIVDKVQQAGSEEKWLEVVENGLEYNEVNDDGSIDVSIKFPFNQTIYDKIKTAYQADGWLVNYEEFNLGANNNISKVIVINFKDASNENLTVPKVQDYKIRSFLLSEFEGLVGLTHGEIAYITDLKKTVNWNDFENTWNYSDGKVLKTKLGGTGVAGVFNETFENFATFISNWNGNISTTNGSTSPTFWNVNTKTPSSGTGASSAQEGTKFCYAEVSSNAHTTDFYLSTTNFDVLTNVEFYYHLLGSHSGNLSLELYIEDTWQPVWSLGGNMGNQWNYVNIDVTGLQAEGLRFVYKDATGYQGDLCLDNIKITSV